jgi:hypothetical protein
MGYLLNSNVKGESVISWVLQLHNYPDTRQHAAC